MYTAGKVIEPFTEENQEMWIGEIDFEFSKQKKFKENEQAKNLHPHEGAIEIRAHTEELLNHMVNLIVNHLNNQIIYYR